MCLAKSALRFAPQEVLKRLTVDALLTSPFGHWDALQVQLFPQINSHLIQCLHVDTLFGLHGYEWIIVESDGHKVNLLAPNLLDTPGGRLRAERERLGLSQDEMAAKCNVHRRTQINYELNRRALPADYLETVDQAGVDSVYVVSGTRVNFDASGQVNTSGFVLHHVLRSIEMADDPTSIQLLAGLIQNSVINAVVSEDGSTARRAVLSLLAATSPVLRNLSTEYPSRPKAATGSGALHSSEGAIAQVVPADRWDALLDGQPRSRVPLVAWALVRDADGNQQIKGVIAGPGSSKLYCEEQPSFLCYLPQGVAMP